MAANHPAHAALNETTKALAELARLSIEQGRFQDASIIAEIAQRISVIREEFFPPGSRMPSAKAVTPPDGGTRVGRARAVKSPACRRSRRGKEASAREAHSKATAMVPNGYPRFYREKDRLVKIGWSKSQGKEYEHRAPKGAVVALMQAAASHAPNGSLFSMDRLLPLTDPETHAEFPSYQIYLALAWLRSEGVIKEHGRDGYAISSNSHTNDRLEALWEALPALQQ